MSPRAAATVEPARVASLRLRWYRAFAVLTAVVVLAGLGNFVGTRLLVRTFRHSAVRVEREATTNVELRADLVVHAILMSSPTTGDERLRVETIQSKIRAGFAEAVDNEEDPSAKGLLRRSLREWEGIVGLARQPGQQADPIAQGEALPAVASRVLAHLDRAGSTSRTAVRLDLARAASLDRRIMAVLAVIKLLAIVLAVRLARRLSTQILRPVSALQKAANHLAAGDLDHRIKVDRDDELGQLAVSFNAMADAVASSQRTLALEAKSDSLTGLVNRAGFRSRLEAALAVPERRNGDQAVLFVDLDDFKDVNDTLGHSAGDEMLRVVAARLTAAVRPGDLTARLGGDEFALLLDGLTDPALALVVAERVVAALAEPVDLDGHMVHARASVGLAIRRRDSTVDGLMHEADVAMYSAKGKGKHRVERFDAGLERANTARSPAGAPT